MRRVFFAACIAGLFFLSASLFPGQSGVPPKAVKGVLDLRGWNFEKNGMVRLEGEWKVFYDTILAPDLASVNPCSTYVTGGYQWPEIKKRCPVPDFAVCNTYACRIVIDKSNKLLGFDLRLPPAAYRFFANDQLFYEAGSIDRDPRKMVNSMPARSVPINASVGTDTIVLVLQYGSLLHPCMGLPVMFLGSFFDVQDGRNMRIGFRILVIGVICILALFYFAHFLYRKENISSLYLGLFAIFSVMYLLVEFDNNVSVAFLRNFPFQLLNVAQWCFNPAAIVFLFLALRALFPREIPLYAAVIIALYEALVWGYPAITPTESWKEYLIQTAGINMAAVGLFIGFGLWRLAAAVKNKRQGSLLTFLGVAALGITGTHDMLTGTFGTVNIRLWSYGLLTFMTMQAIVLARRYVKSQNESLERGVQLAHAEKLATLGTVVAGVAHEVNNPNNSIMLDAQTQQKALQALFPVLDAKIGTESSFNVGGFTYTELKDELAQSSDRITRNSQRVKRIVEDLRGLARKDVSFGEGVDLNKTVASALGVIDHVIRKSTRNLAFEPGKDLPLIKGNVQYLEQVVINLVKNACQALPDPERSVKISTAFEEKAKVVTLTVHDQGKGMDAETLKNIFSPFYTTKGSEGTGLGLSICNNIVKQHQGSMTVESKPGEGTIVRVMLPVDTGTI